MKAFLKAGILTEDGSCYRTITCTRQGGILSPLLANIALSVLDEHFTPKWEELGPSWTRAKRRRAEEPVMRLVRNADDFVIMIHGTHGGAEALREEVAAVLAPMGLRLSADKTRICHIDEGFDFLGWRIQRRIQRNQADNKKSIYTYQRILTTILNPHQQPEDYSHKTLTDEPVAVQSTSLWTVYCLSQRAILAGMTSNPVRVC